MDWLLEATNEPTALLAIAKLVSIFAIPIAGIWALFLWRSSVRNNKNNNELLNQPKFEFYSPNSPAKKIPYSSEEQVYAGSPYQCELQEINESNELYWFDIKNVGGFAARNLKITLVIDQESNNLYDIIENRTKTVPYLQSDHSYSFHLPIGSISFNKYHTKFDAIYTFYILLEYESEYSGKKYKRIYQLDALSMKTNEKPQTNWDKALWYYGIREIDAAINRRINVMDNIRGVIFKKFLRAMPVEVWLEYFWANKK